MEKKLSELNKAYQIMDTASEVDYDEITKLASVICDCPMSLITFFNEEKQFFKSHFGIDAIETPIADSFCKYVIEGGDEPMIVNNANDDMRFNQNPLVVGDPNIVFYAGYPIKNYEGIAFASICVVDKKSKDLTLQQKEALKALAHQVEQLLELRRSKIELEKKNLTISTKNTTLENIIEGTDAGTWEWDVPSGIILLNKKWFQLLGYEDHNHEAMTIEKWKKLVFLEDLDRFERGLADCLSERAGTFNLKYRIKDANANFIWVENRAKVTIRSSDGSPIKVFGIQLNIHKEKVFEDQFVTIADSIPGAVFRYELANDGSDDLTYVSQGFLDLWGISAEEAMEDNSRIWSLILEEDFPKVQKSIEESAQHMTNWVSEWRIKQPNGAMKWHKGIGKPSKNPDGSTYWDSIILDITEEKKISESLLKRNEFIEVILENLPIGIAVNDISTGQASIVNQKFSEIYGWSSKDLTDVNTFFEKIHSDDARKKEMKKNFLADVQSGVSERMSWKRREIVQESGEKRIIDAKNIPLYSQNIMISTVLDHTELYTNQNRLKELNERFRFATKATSDTIWDYDLIKNELYWGENYELNFGSRPSEDLSQNITIWEEKIHPEDRDRVTESLNSFIGSLETNWICNYRFKKQDGTYLEILDKGFIVRDSDEKGTRMIGAMQDITDQKVREQQLKLFESVINHSADPIIITEAEPLDYPNGPKIIYVNDSFEKLTGFKEEEVLGKTPRILQGVRSSPETLKRIGTDLRSWNTVDEDILNYTKDGKEFWVNLSIAPVRNEKGYCTHWISVQKDITQKKNLALFKEVLRNISNVFSKELNFNDSLSEVSNLLMNHYKSDLVEVWLLNVNRDKIYLAANQAQDSKFAGFTKNGYNLKGFKKGEGLPGLTWESESKQHWQYNQDNKNFVRVEIAKNLGLKSADSLPLIYNGEIIGTLILGKSSLDPNYLEQVTDNIAELGEFLGVELSRKRLEVELDQLINYAPGYICSLDDKGCLKRVNVAFYEFFDIEPIDLFKINFKDLVHPADSHLVDEILNDIDAPRKSIEMRSLTKDKKTVWFSWSFNPGIEDDTFYVVGSDITKAKETLEQIKYSNERFLKISKATQDAIWEWDILKNTLFWGDGFKDRFGQNIAEKELNLETWSLLVHPKDRQAFFDKITDSLKDRNASFFKNEYRFKKNNGKYAYVIDSAYIIRGNRGEPIKLVGAIQDITNQKKYEKSLKRLNNELTLKAKLLETSNTELEQFAYVASHDLQEPLRMITSFLSLLEKRYSDRLDEKGKQFISFAVDGATRMRQIILELLDYSRVGNLLENLQEIDIEALIKEVSILHKKQIQDSAALITTSNLPVINAIKSPIRQIFLNLISNSIKYCDAQTTPRIHISCTEEKHFWKFSVKDNGIGIDSLYFEKIFIIFQRLHNRDQYSGTGMGLAITKKIVESMGGSIWLTSEEGKGSTFYFTLKKNRNE
ncbi:PAS domain-containing protein [Cellulophaga sp. Hel_I_12]|uniref:PAS domain-containing protein n=1 Tax=Cellulophaga sp. Hel_I_12 TaxID=1249972 RepID=UPI0006458C23|nr:PAS domain-containing protein [Cellulophaga sp. Hel_I_12]